MRSTSSLCRPIVPRSSAFTEVGVLHVVTRRCPSWHGRPTRAEQAFLEALAAAEKTSMVPNMVGNLWRIATVFAATDRKTEAVELLSTVVTEPASRSQLLTEQAPTNELAAEELDKLRTELDPDSCERAYAAGSAKSYGVAVKELIDTLT